MSIACARSGRRGLPNSVTRAHHAPEIVGHDRVEGKVASTIYGTDHDFQASVLPLPQISLLMKPVTGTKTGFHCATTRMVVRIFRGL